MTERIYNALVSLPGPDKWDHRVELVAESYQDARAKLEAEFGKDATISIWNEEDAQKPRSSAAAGWPHQVRP